MATGTLPDIPSTTNRCDGGRIVVVRLSLAEYAAISVAATLRGASMAKVLRDAGLRAAAAITAEPPAAAEPYRGALARSLDQRRK
jgi:hypothetical protein